MNSLLLFTQSLTSNYGLAIILMTFFLRIILSPLQYISAKSMKRMKGIQPELSLIKEKYKTDTKKVKEETMKLFKENSVNPVMGILPILLQMPLFFALYKLLKTSPAIAGARFGGWLVDLSLPDPFFILPIIAGVLQLIVIYNAGDSQETNVNAKMKFIMPTILTVIMLKMPAAILIYTITTSISSLIEKEVIGRIIA